MKYKITTLTEISNGNKRFCLLPKRALKRCFECFQYPFCKSKIINKKYDDLCKQKKEIREKAEKDIENIDKKIKNIS